MSEKEFNRAQLKQCFVDLAARAKELDEPAIQCCLLTLAGATAGGTDHDLALVCGMFAQDQINQMNDSFGTPPDDDDPEN